MKNKITFLALHLGYGGVESAICNQANMLCNDYDVEIVSLYNLKYNIPYKLDSKIKIIYLTDKKPNKNEFLEAVKNKNIINIFKEGFKSLNILYLKRKKIIDYIKKCNSNIIISTRLSFNKSLGKYAKKGIIKISQEHAHHNNNQKYINKLIKSWKNIDYVMPVSRELTNFYNDKINKCTYITHSLDFKVKKNNYKISKNLIAVARLSKEKGFDDLLRVISEVKNNIPEIKLHLIGDGAEFNNLAKQIKDLKLSDNVVMYGFKNREEINKILKDCSLYMMTSHEESFGLSVIEAMAFGIPCILFDTAKGVLEIVDKNNSVIVKNRNIKKMAQEIIKLLDDENRLLKMSEKAYERSLNYSFDNVQKEWLAFYKNILIKSESKNEQII